MNHPKHFDKHDNEQIVLLKVQPLFALSHERTFEEGQLPHQTAEFYTHNLCFRHVVGTLWCKMAKTTKRTAKSLTEGAESTSS